MSEMVRYTGKLRLKEKLPNETLEEQCKRILCEHNYFELQGYCDSWEEMLYDELYERYVIYNNEVYEVIEKNYRDFYDSIFESYKNDDGTIDYQVVYYNGGCSFTEAIEEALNNIE